MEGACSESKEKVPDKSQGVFAGPSYALDQFGEFTGLYQVITCPELDSFTRSSLRTVPGKDDDGHFRLHGFEYFQDLDPVHIFHFQVNDGQIEGIMAQNPDRLGTAQGGSYLKIPPAEPFGQNSDVPFLVVDE
jgi:hypothetical protein